MVIVVHCCEVMRGEVSHGVMKGSRSCRLRSSGGSDVMGWFCCA